jgi:hypothetical protein
MSQLNPKHKTLITISKIANWLSWVFLVVTILGSLASIPVLEPSPERRNGLIELIFGSVAGNYYYMSTIIILALDQFLDGFITFLGLRAVSLGLLMLVRIDSTYKLLKREIDNE